MIRGRDDMLAGERARWQRQEQRPEPDRAGRNAMKRLSWLTAAFVLLSLVGCAADPGPTAPYPHDNGADIRSM